MTGDGSENDGARRQPNNRRAIDRRIASTAAKQKQLIRLDQLDACGLGARAVQHRARAGRLFRLARGVYATHGPPYSFAQRWLAATYACGPDSLLSDLPAASLQGLTETVPAMIHITNLTGRGRDHPGIVVHRRAVERRDRTVLQGIPCTSVTRTVMDLSASLEVSELEHVVMAADARRRLDRGRLEELLVERGGQPGTRGLRALIAPDPAETRNVNERRMLSICRRFRVSPPRCNFRIDVGRRAFYADFCWPELMLVVEADSWQWHGGRLASERDADRDQILSAAGWRVVHFTRDDIKHRPERTGRRLVAITGSGVQS